LSFRDRDEEPEGNAGAAGPFPPPGVRVAVFDVVGTLIEPDPPVAEAYHRVAARHGVDGDPAEIRRRFQSAWRRQEAVDASATPAFATSRAREGERWRAIVEEVFDGLPESAAIFADLWEHFGRVEAWRTIERGGELVRSAVAAGATVALASNFDQRLLAIAARLEPLSWADHVFPSSEIGWRKPSPEFFRWIERRLAARPTDIVLIGDDPDLDIAAARRAGWHACRMAVE
jgi:putative hydrolase of the HAD superfamily